MLISDREDFRTKKIMLDKEGQFIVINGSILQEDQQYMCQNNRASKCLRQKLIELKEEIDKSTVIVGDFNIPLSV